MEVELISKKEDMNDQNIDKNKVVVVLDILLATSTIVTCSAAHAKAIYPVVSKQEAMAMANKLKNDGIKAKDIYVAGEENAKQIDGYVNPLPLQLQNMIDHKQLILLTTNGTLAIRRAEKAQAILISSLLNTKAVAQKILNEYVNANITVVCSGSNGNFCMEDFYGAGYLIDQMTTLNDQTILSDGALTAKYFYQGFQHQTEEILSQSAVGRFMQKMNYHADLEFVSKKDLYDVVPVLLKDKIL